MFEIKGKYTTAFVMTDEVEKSCVSQIYSFVNHPSFLNPVVIMPDTHAGKGSVIGFTMKMTEKIIPNVIGVDIGCGMLSINIGRQLPIDLKVLDHKIRNAIPFGMNIHNDPVIKIKKCFPWKKINEAARRFAMSYKRQFDISMEPIKYDFNYFQKRCELIGSNFSRTIKSIGTLGGGNHFIEIGESLEGEYWITIHSGSRNFGLKVCNYWQNVGSRIIKKNKQQYLKKKIEEIRLNHIGMDIKRKIREAREDIGLDENVSNELQYLEGEYAFGYLFDMILAQQYAKTNRECMANEILKILKVNEFERIDTVHNFIDFDDLIIRKGAIRSYENEKMIIPFNMRDGIILCEGKSNINWNYSAPHGAGRVMSRTQAKKNILLKDFEHQMNGIFSTSVTQNTLDEAPDAYKKSSLIEQTITPTAKIISRIKPIINMKDVALVKNFGRD